MESLRSDPMRVATVSEVFGEQRSLHDELNSKWQELEHFWGEEKLRIQDFDGQTRPMRRSLEERLLADTIIDEPVKSKSKGLYGSLKTTFTVNGEDIGDIPVSCTVHGFQPEELIVIGTYVDKNIIPGFKYKVRMNLTEDYLFGGTALYLESIGLGYGKRLTFEGESLNENNNYFWSDSRLHGYAFTLQAFNQDDVFSILDKSNNQHIGRVIINNPSLDHDLELSTIVHEGGKVQKEVQVQFDCDAILKDSCNKQNIFINTTVKGVAVVSRNGFTSKAKVEKIVLQDFIMDNCELLSET